MHLKEIKERVLNCSVVRYLLFVGCGLFFKLLFAKSVR